MTSDRARATPASRVRRWPPWGTAKEIRRGYERSRSVNVEMEAGSSPSTTTINSLASGSDNTASTNPGRRVLRPRVATTTEIVGLCPPTLSLSAGAGRVTGLVRCSHPAEAGWEFWQEFGCPLRTTRAEKNARGDGTHRHAPTHGRRGR